jgi:16S rRNA (cytosine967-C5)-methyltransferase
LKKLEEQLLLLGITNVTAFPHDPLQNPLPPKFSAFDAVLLDVPCTGWGTLRRNPDLRRRLLPGDAARLGKQANQLLEAVHTYVKSGGILVYSTCTLSPEENGNVIQSFLEQHTEFTLEPAQSYIPAAFYAAVAPPGWLSVFPADWNLDGAFAARLRKRE